MVSGGWVESSAIVYCNRPLAENEMKEQAGFVPDLGPREAGAVDQQPKPPVNWEIAPTSANDFRSGHGDRRLVIDKMMKKGQALTAADFWTVTDGVA